MLWAVPWNVVMPGETDGHDLLVTTKRAGQTAATMCFMRHLAGGRSAGTVPRDSRGRGTPATGSGPAKPTVANGEGRDSGEARAQLRHMPHALRSSGNSFQQVQCDLDSERARVEVRGAGNSIER